MCFHEEWWAECDEKGNWRHRKIAVHCTSRAVNLKKYILNSCTTECRVEGWDAMKPLHWRSVNSKDPGRVCLYITGADEMKWMSVEKLWNELCGRGKREKPEKNLPRLHFVHQESHMEWPRYKIGTPALRDERITACAKEPLYYTFIRRYTVRRLALAGEFVK